MTRTAPRTPVKLTGAVVVGVLGWVGGYAAAGLYLAAPFLHARDTPGLFAAILVIGSLATVIVSAGIAVIVERLTPLRGPGRTRWRWAATVCYLAAAAAGAAVLLYQHYRYLDQYGG